MSMSLYYNRVETSVQ